MPDNLINLKTAQSLGFSEEEFEDFKQKSGRLPNFIELCLFSELSLNKKKNPNTTSLFELYYNNDNHTKSFIGFNNQVQIKINDNLACSIHIEFTELKENSSPFDDSANCLALAGRKVLASGSNAAAGLNTFQFGLPQLEYTKIAAEGFLKGIGEVGNSSGFPIVGAKISFEKCFNDKPELKTMVVGIHKNHEGNNIKKDYNDYKIFIIGNGSDQRLLKPHRISEKKDLENLKSNCIFEEYSGLKEKILHESTIEAINSGYISGIFAIGKSGLIQAIADLSNQFKHGINLDISKLIRDKNDENILKFFLSAQIAKLMIIAEKGKEKLLQDVYSKWDLNCFEVGKFSDDHNFKICSKSNNIAEIPCILNISELNHDKLINNITREIKSGKQGKTGLGKIPMPKDLKEVAWFLIKHPNIASKKWLNEQYDSMAGAGNMSTNFISDAILINIRGTNNAIALCMTGNQKHTKADASIGAQIAVATAVRRIVSTGARPLALVPSIGTVNLNQAEDHIIFREYISGLNTACKKFNIPVINENINFDLDHENKYKSVQSCPGLTIGMLGLLEDKNHQMTISFKNKGNIIFLIGPSKEDIAASEYLVSFHKKEIEDPPFFDLDLENKIQAVVQELIFKNYVCSVHNVSRGGLFISLVESAMIFGFGFDIITDTDIRLDAFLFGESQGRVLVSINPNKEGHFIDLMMKKEIPFLALGHVTKGEMRVDDISFGFIDDARKAYENAIEMVIENKPYKN